jgi:serine phosphatase RsbU (regulator of sigma subunit)/HAMP domain-containing protein
LKFRFSISRKIAVGFGLFIVVVGVFIYLTNKTLSESREINRRINEIYAPSVKILEELDNNVIHAQQLMKYWAIVQRTEDDPERVEAIKICEDVIPAQLKRIEEYSKLWTKEQSEHKDILFIHIRELLIAYEEVRNILYDFDSYADPINQMMANAMFIKDGTIPSALASARDELKLLNTTQRDTMAAEIARMNISFEKLTMLLAYIAIVVILAGIVIGILTSRSIVIPVNSLKKKLLNLSQGLYSLHSTKAGNDEIGDMAIAVDRLISNFEKTKEFSLNVGAGNFNVDFAPLSEHDELGKALLQMRHDLASYRHEMEEKVNAQTLEIRSQKEEVESQREKATELYTDLQSSIDYAQRLQQTILPSDRMVRDMFPDSFIFFRPKATVSGDFYWFVSKGNKKLVAAADCTGHGVPGAFMSLVGHNVLNQATKVYSKPSQVLNSANRLSSEAMRSESGEHFMKDGMDIALCTIDTDTLELEFSGAHNPVYIIRNAELVVLDGDPFSIGTYTNGEREFTNHSYQLKRGDCIYLFSDGYADQFGGPAGKKFMRRRMRELIVRMSVLPMSDQSILIETNLDQWRGDNEQVDDILLIGIRI